MSRQPAIQIGCHLESGDFGENGTNGEKTPEGWRHSECGKYSNWMPNVAPWGMAILAKMAVLAKMAKNRQRAGEI